MKKYFNDELVPKIKQLVPKCDVNIEVEGRRLGVFVWASDNYEHDWMDVTFNIRDDFNNIKHTIENLKQEIYNE